MQLLSQLAEQPSDFWTCNTPLPHSLCCCTCKLNCTGWHPLQVSVNPRQHRLQPAPLSAAPTPVHHQPAAAPQPPILQPTVTACTTFPCRTASCCCACRPSAGPTVLQCSSSARWQAPGQVPSLTSTARSQRASTEPGGRQWVNRALWRVRQSGADARVACRQLCVWCSAAVLWSSGMPARHGRAVCRDHTTCNDGSVQRCPLGITSLM